MQLKLIVSQQIVHTYFASVCMHWWRSCLNTFNTEFLAEFKKRKSEIFKFLFRFPLGFLYGFISPFSFSLFVFSSGSSLIHSNFYKCFVIPLSSHSEFGFYCSTERKLFAIHFFLFGRRSFRDETRFGWSFRFTWKWSEFHLKICCTQMNVIQNISFRLRRDVSLQHFVGVGTLLISTENEHNWNSMCNVQCVWLFLFEK